LRWANDTSSPVIVLANKTNITEKWTNIKYCWLIKHCLPIMFHLIMNFFSYFLFILLNSFFLQNIIISTRKISKHRCWWTD
jgi:hypothetical protein